MGETGDKPFEQWTEKEIKKSYLAARYSYRADDCRIVYRNRWEVAFLFTEEIDEDGEKSWVDFWFEYGRYNAIDKTWTRCDYVVQPKQSD